MEEKFVLETVNIAGWGTTGLRGPTSNAMLENLSQVIKNQECKEKFAQLENGWLVCGSDYKTKHKNSVPFQ